MRRNEKTDHLEVLYNVSRELAASLDLHEVLSRVLILSTRNLSAETAHIIVLDPNGQLLDAVVLAGGELVPTDSLHIDEILHSGLAGWVISHKEAALLPETRKDPRWVTLPYEEKPKSALCVPLRAQNEVVGALTVVHTRVEYFNIDHLKLLQAIADLAGIAVRNAHLFDSVEQNRNLYRGLFEGSADPIFITNLEGEILAANQKGLQSGNFTQDNFLCTNISTLDPESQIVLSELRIDPDKELHPYTSRLTVQGKPILPVEVRAFQITFDTKPCIQWIFRDISERLQLEKLRESMTAMIYHDLRSPLANIISSMELISDSLPSDEDPQLVQLIEIAKRSGAHMQRLISSLLDFNRLEAGQPVLRDKDVDLQKLLSQALQIMKPKLFNRDLQIEQPDGVKPLLLDVDADMILRVIINLLDNAAKFSPPHSRIMVGFRQQEDEVTFYVEDQGPGIPPESRESIFEKYIRLDINGNIHSPGLGLAFCRLAVKAHGGTIWVESAPQEGSRFIFSLPLLKANQVVKEGS